ncbi:DUF924-domain-containing protein [Testicularia cyperi]|uniref:DUF924-domain-containing protein n=1 Tax=Testicularia cyperi TaxID=1882483 RepID=A0A317XMC1_9BASI|nr:DUF924-domain-containing protein [Testicularia cyperi]
MSAASALRTGFDGIVRSEAPALSRALGDMFQFWKAAGPERYFAKSDEFDQQLKTRYMDAYEVVRKEQQLPRDNDAEEHLGMVLLLDQFPRNAFRGSARQYESDSLARKWANISIEKGLDDKIEKDLRTFFYMPFLHSESLADQDWGVKLGDKVGDPYLSFAKAHRETIARFGRFCHRNEVLGRDSTQEEVEYMKVPPEWAKS